MSDISFTFTWWELALASPIFGWPGLIVGAFLGAHFWRRRPILGAVLGGLAGNFVVFFARILMM